MLIALAALAMVSTPNLRRSEVLVTYLANAGFLITGEGKSVLVDALFRQGEPGYAVLTPATRAQIESGEGVFGDVDLALTTHHHNDHFEPNAVIAHLEKNPEAAFYSTAQAVARMEKTGKLDGVLTRVHGAVPKEFERLRFEHRGIKFEMLNLHHGPDRTIENVGFLIELAGHKILHVGDSDAEQEVFARYALQKESIDIAFLGPHYVLEEKNAKVVRELIAPHHIVVKHVEPDSFISRMRSGPWDKKWALIKERFPESVWLPKELDKHVFK